MSKSFASIVEIEVEPKTVLIVDALNLAFRYKHSGEKDFGDSYMRTINSLKKSYKAGTVIIACDEGSSSYRKEIRPEYKLSRKTKYEQQTEQERLDFEEFFNTFNKVIQGIEESYGYPVLKYTRCEADDIAAYIVKCKNKLDIDTIWLISSDKDWDLLVSDNVSRFSYVTRKEITKENWAEHYEIDIDRLIDVKCLTGDAGDDVPGVPGIGPKRAVSLVTQYGSTYDIIANIPIKSKYAYIKGLNEFGADNLLKNYRLLDLITYCEEALGETNCQDIFSKIYNHLTKGLSTSAD